MLRDSADEHRRRTIPCCQVHTSLDPGASRRDRSSGTDQMVSRPMVCCLWSSSWSLYDGAPNRPNGWDCRRLCIASRRRSPDPQAVSGATRPRSEGPGALEWLHARSAQRCDPDKPRLRLPTEMGRVPVYFRVFLLVAKLCGPHFEIACTHGRNRNPPLSPVGSGGALDWGRPSSYASSGIATNQMVGGFTMCPPSSN